MNGFITAIGCMKCGRCDSVCNCDALERIDGVVRIYYDRCTECMRCIAVYPNKALGFLE